MIACPSCGTATTVIETRGERRRRACSDPNCGRRVTTMEVVVENSRRYDKIVVIPRRDLEAMLRITSKAAMSQLGHETVLAMINEEPDTSTEAIEPAVGQEATVASDEGVERAPAKKLSQASDEALHQDEESNGGAQLTEEELRAIGVDPDDKEQLAAMGFIVQGSE